MKEEDATFMARVLNGMEKRKICKSSTAEWTIWNRRHPVDLSDIKVLTNQ